MRNMLLALTTVTIGAAAVYFLARPYSQKQSRVPTAPAARISEKIPGIPLSLPPGFSVHVYVQGLDQPRDLVFSPGGTLIVSSPVSGQVTALPERIDGSVTPKAIISGESHPHGLAFFGGYLFVAETTRVVRFRWDEKTLSAVKDKVLFTLPDNADHNNPTIAFNSAGKMFVSVGSTCNVCREASPFSGTVVVSDKDGSSPAVFARGLRNAAFIRINPQTGELWGTEMGRDYLGDNLPPDEINIIRRGQNYGWPSCYGNNVHDSSFDPSSSVSCSDTAAPVYEIPAHSAPLGLAFIDSPQFPADWQGDLLVAYHGSWNRTVPTGYKVVHLKVRGNAVTGAGDFLTGFLPPGAVLGPQQALRRPVALVFDRQGNLYLSDDKAGTVYIIRKSS